MKECGHCKKTVSVRAKMAISTIISIAITITIVGCVSLGLRHAIPAVYNFDSITTNDYSLINQAQWVECITGITKELSSNHDDDTKQIVLDGITGSFNKTGTKIVVQKNDEFYYGNNDFDETINSALKITSSNDLSKNINYFGEDGLTIISHVQDEQNEYIVVIVNKDYTVNRVSQSFQPQDITSVVMGKTGALIAFIVLVAILSIIIVSALGSKYITVPVENISKGVKEITNGNLDYQIDFKSNDEFGVTVESINEMSKRLKQTQNERDLFDQQRKQVLAGLTHDLRTPLTAVKGYVEGLQDGICTTEEQQQEYLSTIYSSTLVMERLLDDLSNVTKLEIGNNHLDKQPTDIGMFIDEYVEEGKTKLYKFDLDYEIDNQCKGVMVNLNTNSFSRVIDNIIYNSIKYSQKDVKLLVNVTAICNEKTVTISISDNGIGIDENDLKHIFDLFFRADQARTSVKDGSGIGLAICKEIINLHNGEIWAESKLGKGTTIYISLDRITED